MRAYITLEPKANARTFTQHSVTRHGREKNSSTNTIGIIENAVFTRQFLAIPTWSYTGRRVKLLGPAFCWSQALDEAMMILSPFHQRRFTVFKVSHRGLLRQTDVPSKPPGLSRKWTLLLSPGGPITADDRITVPPCSDHYRGIHSRCSERPLSRDCLQVTASLLYYLHSQYLKETVPWRKYALLSFMSFTR